MTGAVFLAGIRRFALILAGLSAATAGLSLLVTALTGGNLDRGVSIGFDLVGVFFLVVGFFFGNRGPVRLRGEGRTTPVYGNRRVRIASLPEREAALGDSAVFVAVGFAMIVIGVIVDSRFSLF
jgi:hypothetical protein